MAIAKIEGSQRDFSAGELDVAMKRADDNPIMKTGLRQAGNTRILNAKAIQNRPGRRAIMPQGGRTDEVLFKNGTSFFISFTTSLVKVYSSAGTLVFTNSGTFPWTLATVSQIVWDVFEFSIYICFNGMRPLVVSWDGIATWSQALFSEYITPGNQKRTLFYRISAPGILIKPAGLTGSVNIQASAPAFAVGQIGTYIRYCGRQILITNFTNSTLITGFVEEALPPSQNIVTTTDPTIVFNLGDIIVGSITGAKGIVTGLRSPGGGGSLVGVQLLNNKVSGSSAAGGGSGGEETQLQVSSVATQTIGFTTSDTVVGPGGSTSISSTNQSGPQFVSVWDEEVMNAFRGYPSSVFVDQGRLGFCNFSVVPRAIAWSAIANPTDLFVDATPSSAMMELCPKGKIQYVVPGMEGAEFVFCDSAIYYIPITATNPLRPGSVAFNQLSLQGAGAVQPRSAEQTIVYVKAGGAQIGAIQVPGTYNRPYVVDDISQLHSHLFSNPVAIAIPAGSTQYEESYIYVLNADGTLAVGKYGMKNGLLDAGQDGAPRVGWVPWTGAGTVSWVAALNADVLFTTTYAPGGSIVEMLDDAEYLDGALAVNNLPAPFTPPGGKGPLYVFPGPGATVTLIDQATRMMGTYTVDANGNIIAQGNGGENLTLASLVAGQPWTMTVEPFVPDAPPGQDIQQRMRKRRVSRFAAYVSNSTGFLMARLFSGPLTRTSSVLGTIMNTRRVTAWNQDDDATAPPPLREEAQRWRPLGRSFDPRVAIIKDTPGPLVIHEISIEAST